MLVGHCNEALAYSSGATRIPFCQSPDTGSKYLPVRLAGGSMAALREALG